jgi:hypothetical protein
MTAREGRKLAYGLQPTRQVLRSPAYRNVAFGGLTGSKSHIPIITVSQDLEQRFCGSNLRYGDGLSMKSEMQIEMDILGLIALLAPVGLIYSWHFYFTKIRREPAGWRNRISASSLVLASLGALIWPITMIIAPKADWSRYIGVAEQLYFVERWEKVAVYTLLVAFVLCFFGRPRLIAPLAVACIGTTLFWAFSTMP